jgi:hypothetical protein
MEYSLKLNAFMSDMIGGIIDFALFRVGKLVFGLFERCNIGK